MFDFGLVCRSCRNTLWVSVMCRDGDGDDDDGGAVKPTCRKLMRDRVKSDKRV